MNDPQSRQFSIAEARRNLPSLVRAVEKGVVVRLTRRGHPVAVLLSTSDYAGLAGTSTDLWAALTAFRTSADLDDLDIDAVYRDVRDRTPGREIDG